MDASYLTTNHYLGEKVACSVVAGCEIVLTSKYSEIFGIPVALLGVLYYSAVFILAYVILVSQSEKAFKLLSAIIGVGMLATLYFVGLQLLVIKAICQYCMISAFATTILVILVGCVWLKSIKETKKQII